MLGLFNLIKGVNWSKLFGYGVTAFRFFKRFKGTGASPFSFGSLGRLFG